MEKNIEKDTRPMGLRMAYESMWSLVDDVSDDDIEKETKRLEEVSKQYYKKIRTLQDILNTITRKLSVLKEITENRYKQKLRKDFQMTPEHKTLISRIDFGDFDRKPSVYGSNEALAKLLGWELPNEYVSTEQEKKLKKLIDELPVALAELLDPK